MALDCENKLKVCLSLVFCLSDSPGLALNITLDSDTLTFHPQVKIPHICIPLFRCIMKPSFPMRSWQTGQAWRNERCQKIQRKRKTAGWAETDRWEMVYERFFDHQKWTAVLKCHQKRYEDFKRHYILLVFDFSCVLCTLSLKCPELSYFYKVMLQ